jgi:hypothetical protein
VNERSVASCAVDSEEQVRQALLGQMLGPLAFPKGLVSVEQGIAARRRADIVVYVKQGDTLKPLLLIECKKDRIDEAAYAQAMGYNTHLKAFFWGLAHAGGIRTFWKENGAIQSVGFLPPYAQLVKRIGI